MPYFIFSCPEDQCDQEEGVWRAKWSPDRPTCNVHDKEMERDWHREARGHRPGQAYPYVTRHLNGEPIEVRDAGHLRDLCKQHGVVPRPDAAFVEPMEERWNQGKFNWNSLKWEGQGYIRKEGSGLGTKGCWF